MYSDGVPYRVEMAGDPVDDHYYVVDTVDDQPVIRVIGGGLDFAVKVTELLNQEFG